MKQLKLVRSGQIQDFCFLKNTEPTYFPERLAVVMKEAFRKVRPQIEEWRISNEMKMNAYGTSLWAT